MKKNVTTKSYASATQSETAEQLALAKPGFREKYSKLATSVFMLLLIVWAIGQCLRDRYWLTGLMFYFPTPVFVSLLSLAAFVFRGDRKLLLCMLTLPAVVLLAVENHWSHPVAASASAKQDAPIRLRLLHWNMARGVMGWKKQLDLIRSFDVDIVMLSETPAKIGKDSLPGYDLIKVSDMTVACQGTITLHRQLTSLDGLHDGPALDAWQFECELSAGTIRLVLADMSSHLQFHRHPYLKPLIGCLPKHNVDICAGDFNAPRRSLAFDVLPAGYVHAYDTAGFGWSSTWPTPVPFLAIDQCIIGPGILPVDYKLHSSTLSDHRIQLLEFELAQPAGHLSR